MMGTENGPETVNNDSPEPQPSSEYKYFRTGPPPNSSVKVKDAKVYGWVASAFFGLAIASLIVGGSMRIGLNERNPAYALAIFAFTAAIVLGLWSFTRFVEDVNYDTFDPQRPDEITPRARVVQIVVGFFWIWSLWLFFVHPLIPLAIWLAGGVALGRRRWTGAIFVGGALGCLTMPALLLGICFFARKF